MRGVLNRLALLGVLWLVSGKAIAQDIQILEPFVDSSPNSLRIAGSMLLGMYIDRIEETPIQSPGDTVQIDLFFEPCPNPGSWTVYDTTVVLESIFPYHICVTTFRDTLTISSSCPNFNPEIDTVITECLSIDQILSTPERLEPQLEIYPNPARDQIQISLSGNGSSNSPYRIFDFNGRVIAQGFIQTDNPIIGISDLPDGLYVLELNFDGVPIREKFVKSF